MTNKDKETRQIERVGLYAFIVNLSLAGLKAALASFSGSLALTADAIDSLTDSLGSLVIWGGIKLSSRKSHSFPYGLYKLENVMSVAVALLIFFAGTEIARKALSSSEQPPNITPVVICGTLTGIVVTILFGLYTISVGRKTGSPVLLAEGRHRQTDVLSSSLVLVAIVSNYFGFHLDRIIAGFVLIFIGYASWELLSGGMRVLLDASLDAETLNKIRNIIESEPAVKEVRFLVGRNAGRYRFVEADIIMRTNDLKKAHTISEKIESDIRKEIPFLERVLIHYEPQSKTSLLIAVPLEDTEGTVSTHFGQAPYFALVLLSIPDRKIKQQEIIVNPYTDIAKAKGIRVSEWLVNKKVDVVISKEKLTGKGPAYVFAGADIELENLIDKNLHSVINTFRKKLSF
jgi:cation diffusion facilitator family transporter